MKPIVFILFCFSLFHSRDLNEDHLVSDLPSFGKLNSTSYAGYIEVDSHFNSNLFYWLIEYYGTAHEKTPLIIWLNGGPGASSLTGAFTENGPFKITPSNTYEVEDEYAWTRVGHVLYVDQPAGTGYSYTDNGGWAKSETAVAFQFWKFLAGFLTQYPQYANLPLFITGESYGGKYIPHIANEIVRQNQRGATPQINLKGIMLGNGLYDPVTQFSALPPFYENLGLVDSASLQKANGLLSMCELSYNAGNLKTAWYACNNASDVLNHAAGDVFLYDIREKDGHVFDGLTKNLGEYFNQPEVMKAFHTNGHGWVQSDGTSSPNPVSTALEKDFMLNDTLGLFEPIMNGGVRIMLYVGNMDGSVCGYPGHRAFLKNYAPPEFWAKRTIWKASDGLIGGFYREAFGGKFSFLLVHDSGHLVPTDQPLVAKEMLYNFVTGSPFQDFREKAGVASMTALKYFFK